MRGIVKLIIEQIVNSQRYTESPDPVCFSNERQFFFSNFLHGCGTLFFSVCMSECDVCVMYIMFVSLDVCIRARVSITLFLEFVLS